MRGLLGKRGGRVLLIAAIGATLGCSATPAQPRVVSPPTGASFLLAAADAHGAVLLDSRRSELIGIRRTHAAEVWHSPIGYDRIYYWCAPRCPGVVASGGYTVVSGPKPPNSVVWWGQRGLLSDDHHDTSTVLAVLDRHRLLTYGYRGGTDGIVNSIDKSGRHVSINVHSRQTILWFPSSDDQSGLLRINTQISYLFTQTGAGWKARKIEGIDLSAACMSHGRTVIAQGRVIYVDGTPLGPVTADQVGACDIRGKYILLGTFSSTYDAGNQTDAALWTTSGKKLWSKSFPGLSIPALLNDNGRSMVVSDGTLQIFTPQGRGADLIPDVIDAKVVGTNRAATLAPDGKVTWRWLK